jgi:alpha/beta hydrolase fold
VAEIVGIHGIAQQYRGPYQLADVWLSGIRDGLFAAGHHDRAGALSAEEVQVAFFGDLFRPPGTMAATDQPYTASDIRPGLERDFLTALYTSAVATDPTLREPTGAMGAGAVSVEFMLTRLARSRTFARVAQRAFIRDLKQVTAFMVDPAVKREVLRRVRDQIGPDTRVVIGHSLGSVVAYEYLCKDQPEPVQLLITLGSPLGVPNLVFDRLTPAPIAGVGAWPGRLAEWVNVADRDDIVALRKDLAPLFPSTLPGARVIDRLVDNGDEPHAINRYLSAAQTGNALGDVLR